jgi:RNA-binding protein 39
VEKALALSGTVVMGLPIMVQLTEAERNRTHAGDGQVILYSMSLCDGINATIGALICLQESKLLMDPCSKV